MCEPVVFEGKEREGKEREEMRELWTHFILMQCIEDKSIFHGAVAHQQVNFYT